MSNYLFYSLKTGFFYLLREWREQQMIRLKTKDEEEEKDREELKQQAAQVDRRIKDKG